MKIYFISSKNPFRLISQFILFIFLFVMLTCPVMGQEGHAKQTITSKDYTMWSTLRFPQISADGNWISFQLDYEKSNDTLVLLNVNKKKKYQLTHTQYGKFIPGLATKYFVFRDGEKGVGILNLANGKTDWVLGANRFDFTDDGRFLACFKLEYKNGFLKLQDLYQHTSIYINNLLDFKFAPKGKNAVLLVSDSEYNKVKLMHVEKMKATGIIQSKTADYRALEWSKDGKRLGFMEIDSVSDAQRLYCFQEGEIPVLHEVEIRDKEITSDSKFEGGNISFSDDGTKLFFYEHDKKKSQYSPHPDTIKVQVWKGQDKWIYPRQKMDWEYNKKDWLCAWWPSSGKILQLGNKERPDVVLTGDEKNALSFNMLTYEPQYKQIPQSDFYITNLEKGTTKTFIKKLETGTGNLKIAPNGKYLAYFKENNWWIYNIKKGTHTNVTQNLGVSFEYKHPPFSVDSIPFGVAGWTTEDELLVYDKYDIWKIKADDTVHNCITEGRKNKVQYRFYDHLADKSVSLRSITYDCLEYNLANDNILETCNHKYGSGYAILNQYGIVEPFILPNHKNSHLRKADNLGSYIYLKESNTLSPTVFYKNKEKTIALYQSNPQQDGFAVGKTELLNYKNKQNENLKGLLHFPDNYISGKKYPMIVHIYEILSPQYYNYTNPGNYNGDGFNYRNFTAKGYFVLEPDILIQKGNPGISALDCVMKAVELVLKKNVVEKDALGLIGHSFGGYETAFIISQTDLFSAAAVGSGVYDIVGFYHSISKDYGKQQLWRFENQQWRMGKSFYEDREGYYNNSPMNHGKNIKTPTLIWTGNKDYHLNWHQSEQMYLGLRRLGIPVEMLLYENEGHSLIKLENQKDLTHRIENWFDSYLKKD